MTYDIARNRNAVERLQAVLCGGAAAMSISIGSLYASDLICLPDSATQQPATMICSPVPCHGVNGIPWSQVSDSATERLAAPSHVSADMSPMQMNAFLRSAKESGALLVKPEQVLRYLGEFQGSAGIAADILRAARTEFGPTAKILFLLYRDPEIEDEYLKVIVRPEHYEENVRERLQSITASREQQLYDMPGYISVTTDYRPASDNAL
jgi:hypothetical protein